MVAKVDENHHTCGILVPSEKLLNYILALIPESIGLKNHLENRGTLSSGIYVSTIKTAKGLEFDRVILPYLDERRLSYKYDLIDDEFKKDKLIRDLKTLYVGVTRARSNLHLIYMDEITRLLPLDTDFYCFPTK